MSNVPGVYSTEVVGDTVKLYAEAGEKALSVLLPHLVNAGITIARVEMSRPSLDEVFLKTTGRAMADAESADAGGNFGARE